MSDKNKLEIDFSQCVNAIVDALDIANEFGRIDGEHHKTWVIDQMVRALTGCPMIVKNGVDCNGQPYEYFGFGESEKYKKEFTHWDCGIAP